MEVELLFWSLIKCLLCTIFIQIHSSFLPAGQCIYTVHVLCNSFQKWHWGQIASRVKCIFWRTVRKSKTNCLLEWGCQKAFSGGDQSIPGFCPLLFISVHIFWTDTTHTHTHMTKIMAKLSAGNGKEWVMRRRWKSSDWRLKLGIASETNSAD